MSDFHVFRHQRSGGLRVVVIVPNAQDDADGEPGEPGNDEYQATFAAPDPGAYDHAGRVSADGGEHWIYCDRAAGPGSDGAEDGYQIANAGSLAVIDPACADVVCDLPPTGAHLTTQQNGYASAIPGGSSSRDRPAGTVSRSPR